MNVNLEKKNSHLPAHKTEATFRGEKVNKVVQTMRTHLEIASF